MTKKWVNWIHKFLILVQRDEMYPIKPPFPQIASLALPVLSALDTLQEILGTRKNIHGMIEIASVDVDAVTRGSLFYGILSCISSRMGVGGLHGGRIGNYIIYPTQMGCPDQQISTVLNIECSGMNP